MTNREPWRVSTKNGLDSPGVPILFFGDLDAYMTSRPRVLTVGKNPSSKEFPAGERFQRFPRLTGDRSDRKPGTYLKAMSDYFCCDKWYKWFSDFEPVLTVRERATLRAGPRRHSIPTSARPSPQIRRGADSPRTIVRLWRKTGHRSGINW